MADEQNRVWVATHSFRTSSGDEIVAGETHVFGDDPVVQAHPDRFELAANREARAQAREAFRRGSIETAGRGDDAPTVDRNAERSRALRTIERHSGRLRSEAADRLERLVRENDPRGLAARYLDAVGDPDYNRAFGKIVFDPVMGPPPLFAGRGRGRPPRRPS